MRLAAAALLVALMPASSFGIPTVTTSPSSITEAPFGDGVAVGIFFNMNDVEDVVAFAVLLRPAGETTFLSLDKVNLVCGLSVRSDHAGMACHPAFDDPGPYHVAILTLNAGAVGDAVILREGSTYTVPGPLDGPPVNGVFCSLPIGNGGEVVIQITPIPEPAAILLVGLGLLALGAVRQRG